MKIIQNLQSTSLKNVCKPGAKYLFAEGIRSSQNIIFTQYLKNISYVSFTFGNVQ